MFIIYVKREDSHAKLEPSKGWLMHGTLTEIIPDAQTFDTLPKVYQKFADYCMCTKVQFDVYEVKFEGWTVGDHGFACETEARGAARVLSLPVVRCRLHEKPYCRLVKMGAPT